MALVRAVIVETALKLLDEVGIEGLSTRRLAAELGVKGPSLYWYFKNMQELHDQMAEAMLAEVLPSADPDVFVGDWRTWLEAGAHGIRRAALGRRDGGRVLAGARPTGTSPLISFPVMVRRLRDSGFTRDDARAAMVALGRYVVGGAESERPSSEADFEFGLKIMLDGLALRLEQTRAEDASLQEELSRSD
jgi:TetR/AcrR family tetracycline transcriptional repressor